jgi:hypothetical protein
MDKQNIPGVGVILSEHDLESIPEAHCYGTYVGDRFDFTGPTPAANRPKSSASRSRSVRSQIGGYKRERHLAFPSEWIDMTGLDMTLEELWQVRGGSIERLSHSTP